jgi:uncharacterized protein
MDARITRSEDGLRYVLSVDGAKAGLIASGLKDGKVVLYHTEIDPAYGGQGLGSTLVRGALDDIRGRGLEVVPLCPFVRAYIDRHPDYADLVTTG